MAFRPPLIAPLLPAPACPRRQFCSSMRAPNPLLRQADPRDCASLGAELVWTPLAKLRAFKAVQGSRRNPEGGGGASGTGACVQCSTLGRLPRPPPPPPPPPPLPPPLSPPLPPPSPRALPAAFGFDKASHLEPPDAQGWQVTHDRKGWGEQCDVVRTPYKC